MQQEDFYTGEPVITGSPPLFSSENVVSMNSNDAVAADMASFGKYCYEPGARQQAPQYYSPISIYPGGYGYNNNFINPTVGLGSQPAYQPNFGFYNGAPNPVFGGYQQPYYQQPQPQQPTSYHVKGVSNGGEYMPPIDFDKVANEVQMEFWTKQQETEAKAEVDRSQQYQNPYNPFGYGGNYYGCSYYTNPYQYNSLNGEIYRRIEEIKEEAREARYNFNFNMSRLAHNFIRDGISDEDIERRYRGEDIAIPQAVIPNIYELQAQNRLANMQPFDNSQAYRDFHAAVSREFHEIIPENSDLKSTFDNMGIVAANWELEEERHRRRDGGALYNSADNSYKYYVRKKAQERYMREKGVVSMPANMVNSLGGFDANQARQVYVSTSPVLSQSASLADDGTLNVSINLPCNVGSHKGEMYTVNQNEAQYDEKRERFNRFLDTIPGSIYLDNQKQQKKDKYNYG